MLEGEFLELLPLALPVPGDFSTPAEDPALDLASRRPLPGFAATKAAAISVIMFFCSTTVLAFKHISDISVGGVMA